MPTATIIGSGPNGLSAAITLAAAGVETTVLERNTRIGGGCSTAEVTQPGFLHDLGSSTYPLGAASPFYNSLPLTIPWMVFDEMQEIGHEHAIERRQREIALSQVHNLLADGYVLIPVGNLR